MTSRHLALQCAFRFFVVSIAPFSLNPWQGCPLSPTLFCLYLEPVLRLLQSKLCPHSGSIHAFIDDILVRATSQNTVLQIFKEPTTTVERYGIHINKVKSELHAYFITPHFTRVNSKGPSLSTLDPLGQPRNHYKYLGVHFFLRLLNLSNCRTSSLPHTFFHNLSPLPLSLMGAVKLTNLQLIPILTHRLLAHISDVRLELLFHIIVSHLWEYELRHNTPDKFMCGPRTLGGAQVVHLPTEMHRNYLNHLLRYLLNEGPSNSCVSVRRALMAAGHQFLSHVGC